ncbi:MAG TPA: hypothetical protein VKR83_08695 [Ktedonobacteraceae bacterium]|nr:hypothetical protein [Ktedonobacteraceae bacterium]
MFISRRMLIIIGVVGVLLLGALGFAFAFLLSQANASSSAATSTPTVISTTPNPGKTNRACALGIVQSIDSQNQAFVVSESKGKKTVTITVNAQTAFHKRGDAKFSFTSLAVGQQVRVTSQGVCDKTASTFAAQSITVVVSALPAASPTPTASLTPAA